MKLSDIYWYLKQDISKIEKEIEKTIDADHAILQEASSHLLKAGGKRIRPVFVLLSAQFGTYDIERIKHVAVPLELIHMGSLVHDDVIDDASVRRGEETIKAKWDNRIAMYTGDYIFAKAIEIAAAETNIALHQTLSEAMVEMAIGEVEQIKDQYNWNQNMRMYLRRIRRKTALLIAVSCELGALVAEASEQDRENLKRYGYYTGMAFQITDDILDFVGTEKELGKPAGSDLQQGNLTLPALYAMHQDEQLYEDISAYLQSGGDKLMDMPGVIRRIRASGGIDFSKKLADRYLEKAHDALAPLKSNRAKRALTEIAEYIGERKF
ncbi:heptaprenyl diphosphate synthase component II [Salisediminibacterium halotolerans]|uniref:heptaprenyl diphosphate synthase component II n=1 Tax=Salisediminibacterium halotolerans TaxID=517425 RepID=UPI000EB1F246|nr:heptaprenyl diphosphate synthase component II [Salisediminibacterium halotolerans]RLJ77944.1 heptaprenyl diphosphate synthase [Actinophytocola xinjiangensis]RPE88718.1 heptaprenyl diphosphate synthase [Salisediminibacterium halotolerans]TWG36921.1 heptaprenyl diphosphate synthase [Salisediminibacterium halotolerans]GEL08118.1 heptaprenyl diphosphate synthase component 2 [Salisediminibacterium halotolerans]